MLNNINTRLQESGLNYTHKHIYNIVLFAEFCEIFLFTDILQIISVLKIELSKNF